MVCIPTLGILAVSSPVCMQVFRQMPRASVKRLYSSRAAKICKGVVTAQGRAFSQNQQATLYLGTPVPSAAGSLFLEYSKVLTCPAVRAVIDVGVQTNCIFTSRRVCLPPGCSAASALTISSAL